MTEVQEAPAAEEDVKYYWTALPEAVRAVIGDMPSGPAISPEDLRAAIEGYCATAEHKITWADDDPEVEVALLGVIDMDTEDEAEQTTAFLAYEFGAFAIVEDSDSYDVHGNRIAPPDADGKHAIFEWTVVVSHFG